MSADPKAVDVPDSPEIHGVLRKYIATRDRRIAKDSPWSPTTLMDTFHNLVARGEVTVGGRATCGSYRDPSWTVYILWREVVQKAKTVGYDIQEETIKHGNGWATKAGGFWDEKRFTLARCGGAK